jgi:23S rRNA (pseudouridine1915-N3)-methyltransferase
MTRIVVLAVGHPKTPGLDEARGEYERRLVHYFRFEAAEVPAASLPDERAGEARTREAKKLIQRIPDDLNLVALTRTGKPWSTQKLTEYLHDIQTYGHKGAVFIIGGAHGLDSDLLQRARIKMSLSPMTLPHGLARLLITEQLYRTGTILRGEPYHKGP